MLMVRPITFFFIKQSPNQTKMTRPPLQDGAALPTCSRKPITPTHITNLPRMPFYPWGMFIPEFISATLLILIVAIWLEWLPGIVIVPTDVTFFELLPNIILPVIAIAMIMTAHMARMVRSSVIQVMASDYIQMAILKGVPYWKMVFKHVLPNALLPAINVVALTIAWLLGGVVVTEVVFNYPGLGRLVIESISNRDLPVVQALGIILASIYVSINFIADLLTLMLNPRLKTLQTRK